MQSVDRIWFERGEWKDITEKSLSQSMDSQEPTLTETDSDDEHDTPLTIQLPPAGYDIGKLRESVINKLS